MDYKKIQIVAIEESTPPIVVAQYEDKQYRIKDVDNIERLEDENYEEYKIRRKFLEWAEKKRKQYPRVSWPSINYKDLDKGKIDTTLGTYNKEKFNRDIEKVIQRVKEEKEKEAKEKLDEIVKENPNTTYETINIENDEHSKGEE
jgi:hypothetical protein